MSPTLNLEGLAGTQGKTAADQENVDDTVGRGCAVDLISERGCRRQTRASAERYRELREE